MRLPESFRSLRYRDFRVFFVAQTISQISTWMHSVAQTWLILSLTNSPLLLGLFNVVRQSFVNETVGRDDVVNAVALSSAAFNGARIVGPAAAGLVIASVGVAPAFVCSAARATFSCSPPWPRSAWRALGAAWTAGDPLLRA